MNVNVYLPDDIGQRAKEAELPLSQLLRYAVVEELERRDAVAQTLDEVEIYEVEVEDEEGRIFSGQITGTRIANDEQFEVFLTDDERVIAYDGEDRNYWVLNDPEVELRQWLSDAPYAEAMHALGIKPVIDL